MEEKKCAYTIWTWNEAPSGIRLSSPWESGTWIVTYEPGYTFPHHAINVSEHPEWKIDVQEIAGVSYTFIDAEWPDFIEHTLYDWGGSTRSFTSALSTAVGEGIPAKIDCPPKE